MVLNSANRLNGFVLGLFIDTIAYVIYPTLSKLSSEDNNEFVVAVAKIINSVVLLIIPKIAIQSE